MYKSAVIILGVVWLICATYLALARINGLPYQGVARGGSLIASILLLAGILVYIKKHKK